ncbi:unnamed protein product [Lactuca virosa]|uniref:MADS-box domain-containing protein n=1 Tax=Lactuca virosa TaxID=75947 RepID=A0AAU9M421_9ASTR|nr:unnamed protein product [Lactuca virosa]CAH1419373.1 unnamed protein product [Lactuca virosa]
MGRGKIEIKKIENVSCRQVTFSKRRSGLFKKAHELSVLCDAVVGIIVFSNTGRLYEFSSISMRAIIDRYNRATGSSSSQMQVEEVQEQAELEILRHEVARLQNKNAMLKGNDLGGKSILELERLEHQLNDSLASVLKKKEAMQSKEIQCSNLKIDMMYFNLSTQLPIQPGSSIGHGVTPNTVTDIETTLQLWPTCSDHSKAKEATLTRRECNSSSCRSYEMEQ